jgi:E3 ubiquitin-protein ligase TRIP12
MDILFFITHGSFLADLLFTKDHHVLISLLKIIEILMQKLPNVFLCFFIKEGVVNAVEALLNQENYSKSTHMPDNMQQPETQNCHKK